MPSVGFEPAIPASERTQTHALDRVALGIGRNQSRDLPGCSAMPLPTALPRMYVYHSASLNTGTNLFYLALPLQIIYHGKIHSNALLRGSSMSQLFKCVVHIQPWCAADTREKIYIGFLQTWTRPPPSFIRPSGRRRVFSLWNAGRFPNVRHFTCFIHNTGTDEKLVAWPARLTAVALRSWTCSLRDEAVHRNSTQHENLLLLVNKLRALTIKMILLHSFCLHVSFRSSQKYSNLLPVLNK